MSKGCDRLHFYRVHFVEAMIQNTRGVDNLVPKIFIFSVADVQGLCCEWIGLNLDVGLAYGINKWWFANIWVPSE